MAEKNPVVNITKMESSESSIATSSTSLAANITNKAVSTRPRRGVEDNSNNPSQNNTESTPVVATVTTRTRKTAEETSNPATNGKAAPGRATRNKPAVSDNSNSSSDGGNGNNNSANSGANSSGLSGSKDDNTMGGTGKTAAPTEEQRTMKTRSAK